MQKPADCAGDCRCDFGKFNEIRRSILAADFLLRTWKSGTVFRKIIELDIAPIILVLISVVCVFALPANSAMSQHRSQPRMRVYWGSDTAIPWSGKIYLSDGDLTRLTTLGVDKDASCSAFLTNGRLELSGSTKSRFNGFDFSAQVSEESFIFIDLQAGNGKRIRKSFAIRKVLDEGINLQPGNDGAYIAISRAPGDGIEIDFQKDSAVFQTGERFSPSLSIQANPLKPRQPYRALYRLVRSKDRKVFWSQLFDHVTDKHGFIIDLKSVAFKLPEEPGAYEFQVIIESATKPRMQERPLQRTIQVVVVSPTPNPNSESAQPQQRVVVELDPVDHIPNDEPFYHPASMLRGIQKDQLHNNKTTAVPVIPKSPPLAALDVGGWHVFPIEIKKVGVAHELEMIYPVQREMSVGVSLLQIDPNHSLSFLGSDGGFQTSGHESPRLTGEHTIRFWPTSKRVYVVVVNRDASKPAYFGNMKVSEVAPTRTDTHSPKSRQGDRQFLAYYNEPFFADNFDAPKSTRHAQDQPITDWEFFFQGGMRLVEQLRAQNKTGALLTVVSNGSCIYPSQHLNPNPKFDNGVFSKQGFDPNRKDILEMLLQMFDAENLTLIPVVKLSAKLPQLEKRRFLETAPNSMDLTDPTGQKWQQRRQLNTPGYNVLCPTVQNEIANIVKEIRSRYAAHASFGGVAIQLGPDTFVTLPNEKWGFDQTTVASFLKSEGIGIQSIDYLSAVQRLTSGDLSLKWKIWRTRTVSRFLKSLSNVSSQSGKQGKLFLLTQNQFRDPNIYSKLTPSLRQKPDYSAAMNELGIDLDALKQNDSIVFLNTHRIANHESFVQKRVESVYHQKRETENNRQVDFQAVGQLFAHHDQWVHLSQLEQLPPFNRSSQSLIRYQPVYRTGLDARKKYAVALAHQDTFIFAEGGKILAPLLQKETRNWRKIFSRLPATKMKNVSPTKPSPVTVRWTQTESQTIFYAVNNCPWKTTATISIEAPENFRIDSLGDQMMVRKSEKPQVIELEIEAFDIAAGAFDSSQVKITGFATPIDESTIEHLQKQITSLKFKLSLAKKVQPLKTLRNPDFEYAESKRPLHWRHDANQSNLIEVVKNATSSGSQFLHLRSSGNATWIRSQSIPPVQTGRLSLSVFLKISDPTNQPPLRLAIQGTHNGREYYRFAKVGSLVPDRKTNQLTKQWKKFVVHFDDLPTSNFSDLQIGFDLMGQGEVSIDNVKLYDRLLDDYDQKAISQTLALASYQLVNQRDVNGCRKILDSYWLKFVDHFLGQIPANDSTTNRRADASPRTSLLQKVRNKMPQNIFRNK